MTSLMKTNSRILAVVLIAGLFFAGCGKKDKKAPVAGESSEPDKVLFERAMKDMKDGKHIIARLTLQTLLNTYPDSEYLAKAQLSIADSFYQEGGTANLAQAVSTYRDFITFFPFLEEAAYAQLQIGRTHYRQMEKPDRDRTQVRLAEQELQKFLLTYPNSPLYPEAEQRLREVQEVLAEGDFRVGLFYSRKDTPNARRASIFRLAEVVDRYPLYSQADRALWMIGDNLQRLEQSQMAGKYFSRLVQEYPLSPLVEEAKQRLEKIGVPVPQPSPEALERMQKEQSIPRQKSGVMNKALGMVRSGPSVNLAARVGKPNLTPPPEGPAESLVANKDLLNVGPGTGAVVVETVPSGSAGSTSPSGTTGSNPSAQPPASGKADSADASKGKKDDKSKKDADKAKESTSKKKKGLRKIIPW